MKDDKNELKVLDLFSGIGGFSLGLEAVGPFRTVAFCEQEPYCQAVLRKHWPDTPIFNDVRTIPTDGLGRIDIIVGGFPCQPWSQAGEQRGAEDDRDLWPEVARLVAELRPKYLIGENVRGFVNQRMGLERSLSDLARIGYSAIPFVIPACAVDAPHRRDRVWIVAAKNDAAQCKIRTKNTKPSRICTRSPASAAHADNAKRRRGAVEGQSRDGRPSLHGEIRTVMADAATPRLSHRRSSQVHRPETEPKPQRRRSVLADSREQGLQGAGDEPRETGDAGAGQPVQLDAQVRGQWSVEPGMGGMADGVPRWLDEPDTPRVASGVKNRVPRLKALGNAVVPQVVSEIGRAILAAERLAA